MRYETMLRSAIALSVLAVSPVSAAHAQLMKESRSYATRASALEVDGKAVGTVQSVEGGYAKADVAVLSVATEEYPLKHVSNVRFEPITFRGDVNSLAGLAKKALEKPSPVSGRVMTMGMTGKSIASLDFFNAIPTRVAIADLDASSKEPCSIEITLTPESTRRVEGGSGVSQMMAKQEKCVRSNFTVKIPGVVTTGVMKVENLALTREVTAENLGSQRIEVKNPAKPSIPNVVLTVSEATAKDFWSWYDSFLIKGDNGQDKERTIDVQLTSPDLKSVSLTLQGTGVGMVAMRPLTGSGDNIAKVEVELYVTRWAIAGAAAP
jgi:hypothetical protein